jgi:tetratricopeptide (TPR) repeat protein
MTALTPSTEDRSQAQEYGEESLRLARQMGDKASEAYALTGLALLAQANSDLDNAIAFHEQSLWIFREIDDRRGAATVLGSLGLAICDRSGYPLAATLIRESLRIFADLGDQDGVALELEGLACVAAWSAEPLRAARLFGAAEAFRDRIGVPVSNASLARHEAAIARLRIELDDEKFLAYWEEGRSLATVTAVAEGLASGPSDVALPLSQHLQVAG